MKIFISAQLEFKTVGKNSQISWNEIASAPAFEWTIP